MRKRHRITRKNGASPPIDSLYNAFQPNRLGDDFIGCECCVSTEDLSMLRDTPLRELTSQELDRYSQKALTTWGEVRHFKHFLPRLLELLVVDPEGIPRTASAEVVLGKLKLADWMNWHPQEVSAVNEALDLLWETTLDRKNAVNLADEVLCGIARTGRDVQPLLRTWLEKSNWSAAEQLASFIDWHVPSLLEKKQSSAGFWDDVPDQYQKVIDWLKSPEVREFIRSSAALSADDREQSLWLLESLVSAEG